MMVAIGLVAVVRLLCMESHGFCALPLTLCDCAAVVSDPDYLLGQEEGDIDDLLLRCIRLCSYYSINPGLCIHKGMLHWPRELSFV